MKLYSLRAAIILTAVLLAGCAPPQKFVAIQQWGDTPFDQARAKCQYEQVAHTPATCQGIIGCSAEGNRSAALLNTCMEAAGWRSQQISAAEQSFLASTQSDTGGWTTCRKNVASEAKFDNIRDKMALGKKTPDYVLNDKTVPSPSERKSIREYASESHSCDLHIQSVCDIYSKYISSVQAACQDFISERLRNLTLLADGKVSYGESATRIKGPGEKLEQLFKGIRWSTN